MNIEDYRDLCLSLGNDVEEKFPFTKFKNGKGVLVFYVCGHMFSYFDCDEYSVISLKCQPERIVELKEENDCIGDPFNESPKHWLGINPNTAPDDLLKDLTRNSYEIVKAKYTKKKHKTMNKMIAICGLDCEKCDAFIATKNNDQALREKTAKLWSELNKTPILPEHINCEGCRMNGAKTVFCNNLCEIRKCAVSKNYETCGDCPEMEHCPKLGAIHANNKDAKNRLKKA